MVQVIENSQDVVSPVIEKDNTVISYTDLRTEAEKPFSERKKVRGRHGEDTVIRKYHLTEEERQELISKATATGGIHNPLSGRVGAYWGQVEALICLGINTFHTLKSICGKMEEVMNISKKKRNKAGKVEDTTLWKEFAEKGCRTGASCPKDCIGRIEQNFKVLQRLPREGNKEKNPYGIKLAQFGMSIDIEYREVSVGIHLPYVMLNTSWTPDGSGLSIRPLYKNPFVKRGKRSKKKVVEAISNMDITGNTESVKGQSDNDDSMTEIIPESIEVISILPPENNSTVASVPEFIEEKSSLVIHDTSNDFDKQIADYEAGKTLNVN